MAILEMSKICVFGLHSDRKAILETLHCKEVVEVCEPDEKEAHFEETAKSIAQFERHMLAAESALAVLDEYTPEKSGFFSSRRAIPIQRYQMVSEESGTILKSVNQIIGLSDKIREHSENIRQISAKQTALEPYLVLDVPTSTHETAYTFIKTGTLDGAWQADQLQKELEDNGLCSVYFEILSVSKEYTYVWFLFCKSHEQKVATFLQAISFAEPIFNLSHHNPARENELLEDAKNSLKGEMQEDISEIKSLAECRRDIELFYDHLSLRKDKYQVLAKTGITEHAFLLEGYVPKKQGDSTKQFLESQYMAYVELSAPETTDDVPTVFRNNPFTSPAEGITETYSMPSPTDVDPNPVMAFFYYLFFGMMLSDAGYGLLLMLICGYLGFSKRLERQKRSVYRMFCFCGVSTMFWGLMYGSFFGNIVYTISATFLGEEVTLAPLWLDPIPQALSLLIFSVALGMLQILIGMGIKFYTLCRQKKLWDAVFDVGFWMLVLLGLCLLSAGMGLSIPVITTIGISVALSGATGLLLTGGRKNKNIVGKILGGIVGLYNIMGYVSDALSYCRLMALGLATGAIANVVNMLGSMFGRSVVGAFLFILIFLLGHSLNFAINMLGAYVHTNRLQYVEFFSKFYEGGGRKFSPFHMRTKYYRFSEE